MSKLKELTLEVHRRAERTGYASKLVKGLTPEEYYQYLYNQYLIYSVLEYHVKKMFPELHSILREDKIFDDLKELQNV